MAEHSAKTAVVTGANRGLGAGFVEVLLEKGYIVYACARNLQDLQPKDGLIPIRLNLEQESDSQDLKERILKDSRQIDLLINNAGLNAGSASSSRDHASKLGELSSAALMRMFKVNTVAPLILIQELKPFFAKEVSILNISSSRASFHDKMPSSSANYGYRASKAALNMITQAMVHDLDEGIRTVAIHPGNVKTDMNSWGETNPKEAADQIITTFLDNWTDEMQGGFRNADGSVFHY